MKSEHAAATTLAREIIAGWRSGRGNFCVVVPPLTSSGVLFELLEHPGWALENPAEAEMLAIACCPHGMFRTADELVDRVCARWNAQPKHRDFSYQARLESVVEKVSAGGRTPILLLPSFHDIVTDLPEQLGACLRALNQHRGLLCVVEAPRKWWTMKERWHDEGRKGMGTSQFGQGYEMRSLHGFTQEEIVRLLGARGLSPKFAAAVLALTGGFTRWVELLLVLAVTHRNPREWVDPLLATVEFQNFLSYLDSRHSSANRHALGRLHLSIASQDDLESLLKHDWADQLLAGDNSLTSTAVGIDAARSVGSMPSLLIEKAAVRLIRHGNAAQACEMIERAELQNGPLRNAYLVALVIDRAASGEDDWSRVAQALGELEKRLAPPPSAYATVLGEWREFVAAMRRCASARTGANPDVIGTLCGRTGQPPDVRTALRLIEMRLAMAEKLSSFFLATTAILTVPEALLQLYCAVGIGLRFWDPPEPEDAALAAIRALPRNSDFRWPAAGRPMNVADLLALSWPRMQGLSVPAQRLVQEAAELDQIQQLFSQDRNPLAHQFTFGSKAQWLRYAAQCRALLKKISLILMPDVAPQAIALPPLDTLLEAVTADEFEPLVTPAAEGTAVMVNASVDPFEIARRLFQLSTLIPRHELKGGLSGSGVHLVQFQGGGGPIKLGILKVTDKRDDFVRERDCQPLAAACWLREHIAVEPRFQEENGTGFILAPLAFRATRDANIDRLHDLILNGERQRAIRVCQRLGGIYGGVLGRGQPLRQGAPRQHFVSVWDHWQTMANGFDWDRWNLPGPNDPCFVDEADENLGFWRNPLACAEDPTIWKSTEPVAFAWDWQHRDLNACNILVAPSAPGIVDDAVELRFIDLEKVCESSALLDLCWASFWILLAGAERSVAVSERVWNDLPDAFLAHSLERVSPLVSAAHPRDMGAFQLSLDGVAAIFETLRASATSVDDPLVLREMAALTMAGAALAKAFYEVRDLDKAQNRGEPFSQARWQRARCFFRIAARALRPFTAQPNASAQINLSAPFSPS